MNLFLDNINYEEVMYQFWKNGPLITKFEDQKRYRIECLDNELFFNSYVFFNQMHKI